MRVKQLVDLGQDAVRAVVAQRAVNKVVLDVDDEERGVRMRVLGSANAFVLGRVMSTVRDVGRKTP